MPVCSFCKEDTAGVKGCGENTAYRIGATTYSRIPFGKETGHLKVLADYSRKGSKSCTHCNTSYGSQHHSDCHAEECPKCHRQMLLCGGHGAKAVRVSRVVARRK